MRKLFSIASLFLALASMSAQAVPYTAGPFDFNAPIVQSKSNLTNLSPAGQIVFENSTLGFWGLAPDGTWVSFGSTTGIRSQVKVNGSAGNGSVGVRTKIYTTVELNQGSDIIYLKDPTGNNGDTFTIATNGLYAISYSASASAGDYFAISVDADPTVVSSSLPLDEVLARCQIFGANSVANCSWTGELTAGQVIMAHQDGATAGTANFNTFTITKIAN